MQVSVIMPVWNAAPFVEQAVRSVLALEATGEVILVEDASKDESLAVCRQLAERHDRVRLLQHPGGVNRGAGPSRNLGIEHARCELIAFLDADDLYLPNRFEISVKLLREDSTIDGVYEPIELMFEDEAARARIAAHKQSPWIRMHERFPPEHLFEALVGGGGDIHTNGITVRRALFERTGLFDDLRLGQDVVMWAKMAAKGRLVPGYYDEPVSLYRIHSGNRAFPPHDRRVDTRRSYTSTLLVWSLNEGLDARQTSIVLRQWLRRHMFQRRSDEGRVSQQWRAWRQMSPLLRQQPAMCATMNFWKGLLVDPWARPLHPRIKKLLGSQT